ncbi:MAG: hypothetical protein QME81_03905 [bacterium]|nr:hypothetical protein [bacterium]
MQSDFFRILIILGFVVAVLWLILNPSISNPLSVNPVILFVGGFSAPDSFGSIVKNGVECAREKWKRTSEGLHPDVREISFLESSLYEVSSKTAKIQIQELLESLQSRIVAEIAEDNIVAIISANTSQSAPTILKIGKVFNIPVLLTVATNDKILEGYDGIGYRLLARDTQQAKIIKEWYQKLPKDSQLGVFHDHTRYGIGLRNALVDEIGPLELLTFNIGSTIDVAGAFKYGVEAGIDAWISIGYKEDAIETITKKSALKISGPLLFSDGAYGEWMTGIKAKNTYLSFPKQQMESVGKQSENGNQRSDNLKPRGYSVYGYDAYCIIDEALNNLIRRGKRKYELAAEIASVACELSKKRNLYQKYEFDENGENKQASFCIFEVGNGVVP